MDRLPSDLTFWLLIPGLVVVLLFAWLIYLGRGKRSTAIALSGLGITLSISSVQNEPPEEGNISDV